MGEPNLYAVQQGNEDGQARDRSAAIEAAILWLSRVTYSRLPLIAKPTYGSETLGVREALFVSIVTGIGSALFLRSPTAEGTSLKLGTDYHLCIHKILEGHVIP